MSKARDTAVQAAFSAWDEWADPPQDQAVFADAASDVWEPIARTLRDHAVRPFWTPQWCDRCEVKWPCPAWQRASEALDG